MHPHALIDCNASSVSLLHGRGFCHGGGCKENSMAEGLEGRKWHAVCRVAAEQLPHRLAEEPKLCTLLRCNTFVTPGQRSNATELLHYL